MALLTLHAIIIATDTIIRVIISQSILAIESEKLRVILLIASLMLRPNILNAFT